MTYKPHRSVRFQSPIGCCLVTNFRAQSTTNQRQRTDLYRATSSLYNVLAASTSSTNSRNLKMPALREFVWTENILKTELFEKDGVMIIM